MNNIKRLIAFIALFNIIATIYVLIHHVNETAYYIVLICLYAMYLMLIKFIRFYLQSQKDNEQTNGTY